MLTSLLIVLHHLIVTGNFHLVFVLVGDTEGTYPPSNICLVELSLLLGTWSALKGVWSIFYDAQMSFDLCVPPYYKMNPSLIQFTGKSDKFLYRKQIWWSKFKLWARLVSFPILIPYGKSWIHLSLPQQWVYSKESWALQNSRLKNWSKVYLLNPFITSWIWPKAWF